MPTEKDRPVFLDVENMDEVVMKDNKVYGDADFARLKDVRKLEAEKNLHVTSDQQDTPRSYKRMILGFVVVVLCPLLVAGIVYWLGWN